MYVTIIMTCSVLVEYPNNRTYFKALRILKLLSLLHGFELHLSGSNQKYISIFIS